MGAACFAGANAGAVNDKPDLWFPVGVHWYLHPRFVRVRRPAAYGLYWAMNGWAREQLTDGFVPNDVIVDLLSGPVKADANKDRAELIRVGLLTEKGDGVVLHRFLGWNDSAEKVRRRQDAARNAARIRWESEPHPNGNADGMHAAPEVRSGLHTKKKKESKPEEKTKHHDEGSSSVPSEERARRAS